MEILTSYFKLFQTSITNFLPLNKKGEILNNVLVFFLYYFKKWGLELSRKISKSTMRVTSVKSSVLTSYTSLLKKFICVISL